MLSRTYFMRMLERGQGEACFSPDWHEKNPAPTEGSVVAGKQVENGVHTVTLNLRQVLLPSGDVVMRDMTDGEGLADGERLLD